MKNFIRASLSNVSNFSNNLFIKKLYIPTHSFKRARELTQAGLSVPSLTAKVRRRFKRF